MIYGKIKSDIGKILRELCDRKGIEIWEQTFLVERVLCRYSRKKYCEDKRIYPAAVTRGLYGRPNFIERVYGPVYG